MMFHFTNPMIWIVDDMFSPPLNIYLWKENVFQE